VFYGLFVLLIFSISVLCCFSSALVGENCYIFRDMIYGFGPMMKSVKIEALMTLNLDIKSGCV
jgi:hypothetical protein